MVLLRRTIHDAVVSSCGTNEIFNASQMRDVLKLGIQGARLTQKSLPRQLEEIWQPSIWRALAERLSSSSRYKGAVQMCKQLAQLSTSPKPEVVKRKAAAIEVKEDKQKKRKKIIRD